MRIWLVHIGSGVFSSAGDVLEMSVERGVGGVHDMCMFLTVAPYRYLFPNLYLSVADIPNLDLVA